MIFNPDCGWCDFNLGTFHGTPSYITNVPVDLLTTIYDYLTTGTGIAYFDEEGSEFSLAFTPYSLFIIEEKECPVLFDFSGLNIKELILNTVNSIANNVDTWSSFSSFNEEDYDESKAELTNLISSIRHKLNRTS